MEEQTHRDLNPILPTSEPSRAVRYPRHARDPTQNPGRGRAVPTMSPGEGRQPDAPRCGHFGQRGRCQLRTGHAAPHALIWESVTGPTTLMLRRWSSPRDSHDDPIDDPFAAAVDALSWATGYPQVERRG